MQYYLDTNIYLNFFYNEKIRAKNLSNETIELVNFSLSCKFKIIISSWVIKELKDKISTEEIKTLLILLKPKLITINYTQEELEEAKKMSKEHFQDALHVILAKKAKADAIITRDKGFSQYSHLIKSKVPQDILF